MSQESRPVRAAGVFGRRGEHLVVLQFALMLGFVLCPVWPGDADRWLASGWRVALSAPFALIAVLLAGFGTLALRAYLTPLPYPVPHNRLVRHGVYAWVRHPLYASLLFAGAAATLYWLSLSHLVLLIVAAVFFNYKADKEEVWLRARHPEYASYAQQVAKFIPWIY